MNEPQHSMLVVIVQRVLAAVVVQRGAGVHEAHFVRGALEHCQRQLAERTALAEVLRVLPCHRLRDLPNDTIRDC